MATGALDANGIWQYGEDDAVSPWSPYMNLGEASVSTQIGLLKTATAATTWTTPTLTGSWADYGAGLRLSAYRRAAGMVELRGSLKSGGTGSANPMFTLPSGFRPIADEQFIVVANTGVADLRVDTAGRVWVAGYLASGNNGIVSIAGIRFAADGS